MSVSSEHEPQTTVQHPLVFGHFTDLLPLWNKEDQHDHDLLKHHDKNVESTLTRPGTALNRLTCV